MTTLIYILFAISFLTFHGFLFYAHKKIGMTHSISATFDELEKIGKEWVFQVAHIIFSSAIILAAILVLAGGIMVWEPVFVIIAGVFIICSAIAGDTEEHKLIMRNHVIYAHLGIIAGSLFLAFSGLFWLWVAGGLATGAMVLFQLKNHTYWVEWKWYHLIVITFLISVIVNI